MLVAISNTSGLAGIAHWINTYFKLKGDAQIQKTHPMVADIKQWVDAEYESGRITVLTDDEILDAIDAAAKRLNNSFYGYGVVES